MMEYIGIVIVAVIFLAAVASKFRNEEAISMPSAPRSPGRSDSIEALVIAGRKIEAIKLLRSETGLGLKEAKDEIDDLARSLRPR